MQSFANKSVLFTTSLYRQIGLLSYPCCSRHRSNDLLCRPNGAQSSERAKAVTSFYFQSAIDQAAAKASVRLMPATMLYSGRSADGSHLLRSAQYLQKELPVRIAHRITSFRRLPFIVGCHPSLLAVHELYIRAFHLVSQIPPITDADGELKFSQAVSKLLEDHREVVTMLAEGFTDCRRHIQDPRLIKSFLDSMLTSRLGMRLLCEHHLMLHEGSSPNQVGIITINFSPKVLVEKKAEFTTKMCIEKYGVAPEVKVNGHVSSLFPYIASPLDYIMHELLKNAMRSTVEAHASEKLPPVNITIANNDVDFIIKISDRGGGIRHDIFDRIWEYGFTSSGYTNISNSAYSRPTSDGLFDAIMENRASGKMHGYGFGLPVCKAYAEYLGGSLSIETMQGIGTDVFIRLRHIDGRLESFRI
jgi:[3-methyl-2-oxobutanoate dehydrogenase (acetyl-transferring)] kinase